MLNEQQAMRRVIELALKGNGHVSPNPRVGAVIIENGAIIAEGWHTEYGAPHAEVEAVRNSGRETFEDCTLVVNLEPCSHFGKTPPCADMIIEKKFSRVVIGMIDPNPEVSGLGIQKLEEAGIEVVIGVLEDECRWINRFFVKHITTGLPYVMLKFGQSIDGCIATERGESKWITCEESRRRVHLLRTEVDAVIIGKKTALADNPHLTVRDIDGRDPKRIVFDTDLSLPLSLNVFKENSRQNTFICCNPKAITTRKADNLRLAGLKLIPVDINEQGVLNIASALYSFTENGISSVMVEGGAKILSSFAKSQMIDEMHIFIAPKIMGNGIHSFGNFNINYLKEALNFKIRAVSKSGDDIHTISTFE